MDAQTFDRLIAEAGRRPSRRAALRVLGAAVLALLLPARAARAQNTDNDQDGLFDADETNIYGTRPDLADTDGDGFGDGQEICNRDRTDPNCQQDLIHTNPLVNEDAAAPPPPADPAPPPAATCAGLGEACAGMGGVGLGCCGAGGGSGIQCCFDANGAGICTDVSTNSFLCPDPGVPATGCAVGMTNCGGFCTELSVDHGNCGACGNRCSQLGPDYNCRSSTCVRTCQEGLTDCFGRCIDLLTDFDNCGGCGDPCREPGEDELISCQNGRCVGLRR